ncbi:MAG: Com family DNA-binding transcriptional regulator [Candidatus Saganbacteria bacterium]|nr:Com family DNA-binding transcriptional regulator [Candidatus Saganbacteria bacterium]
MKEARKDESTKVLKEEDKTQSQTLLKEFRCKFCHRLLAKVSDAKKVEIKCPKCKTMNLYSDNETFIVQIDEAYISKQIAKGRVNYNLVKN